MSKTKDLDVIDWGEFFYYDESSPSCLRWKVDRIQGRGVGHPRVRAGDVAGSLSSTSGYYNVMLNGVLYLNHRVIFKLFNKSTAIEDLFLDHENGIRSDNKITNLRLVSPEMNARNVAMSTSNKSGIVGVYYREISNTRTGKVYRYWVAQWQGVKGKKETQLFSVDKYGEDEAFRLAVDKRESEIEQLNANGAGYSCRHGKAA